MLRGLYDAMYGLSGLLSLTSFCADFYLAFRGGLALTCLFGAVAAMVYRLPLFFPVFLTVWLLMFAVTVLVHAVRFGVSEPAMSGVVARSALTLVVSALGFCALWVAAGLPA